MKGVSSFMTRGYRKEIIKVGEAEVETYYGRAHRYKPTSLELMSRASLCARVLDVGGGDRIISLPNFVNFDRFRYSGLVTVVGDAHSLPFKDDIFDLILLEAVVEHLKKPWVAVEEFYRVLRSNGYIYADVAFMQPLHSYPSHYFNMTREGVKVLFEKFEEVDSGVQEYQMPSYTLTFVISHYIRCLLPWLDKYAENVESYDIDTCVSGNSRLSSFLAFFYKLFNRALTCFDRFIKPEKSQAIAAGTYFVGRK